MIKEYDELVFSISQYNWKKTDEEARNAMWEDIAKFLQILVKNEYIAVIYDDDTNVIVVQYAHNEKIEYWGDMNPYWITDEEYDKIIADREELNNEEKDD